MYVAHADQAPSTPVAAGQDTSMQVLIEAATGPHFAMRRFTILPGGGMPPHTNAVEHQQYVLGGRARIGVGEQEFDVQQDDVVHIPAGTPHWYRATGDRPFVFLCLVPNLPDRIQLVR